MSAVPKLTVAGDNDLASEMARHAVSTGLADPVYLWRDPRDPLPAETPVIVVADPAERAGFARQTISAGLVTVTLPIPDLESDLAEAAETGRLRQISRLHGNPTLARLHQDAVQGREGRRYGIYAAHRLPRNDGALVEETLDELVVYVASLGDGPVRHVRATAASVDGRNDGWFVLVRFDNDTVATLEVSAVLPESDDPEGDLLIEVTGSDAVLRGEPKRQSVLVREAGGVHRQPWYAEPAGELLELALRTIASGAPMHPVAAAGLLQAIRGAAASDRPAGPGGSR